MNRTMSYRDILKFWVPLAGTWLMMSLEGPFIAAVIARLVDPKFNLAAYGVAFSFALIIEAPVIMMMTASTSLVKDFHSLKKLRQFTWTLNLVITAIMLLMLIPRFFFFLTIDLIGLPQNIAQLTHIATIILLPWPAAIGFRRFYQGVLIRNHATRRVAFGTLIRLFSMSGMALSLYFFTDLPGVYIGTAALSAGVTMEAISTRIMVHFILKRMATAEIIPDAQPLSFKGISKFYYPLALTSMLTLGVHPLITFFIGKSALAIESLAVLPVIHSFVFLFRGVGLSFQEAAITLLGEDGELDRRVYRFAATLALGLSGALFITAITPLASIWFSQVTALSSQLAALTQRPLFIMVIFPATTVLISMQRALLVKHGDTKPITIATLIEVIGIIVILYVGIIHLDAIGVYAAVSAFVGGRLAANLYLHVKTRALST
jgi:Na+-driven multidrug efflux pump